MDEQETGFPANQPPEAQYWYAAPYMQPPRAPRPRSMRRWLMIGGGTAALLVALGVGVAVGASALSAQAAGPSGLQTALTNLSGSQRNNGDPGHGPERGGDLTVSAVSGQTITAKRPDGTSVTIKVSSSTTYTRADKTVSLSAITSGETIHVMGQRNSDGSITATRVDIELPHVGGQVTAISGSTITVKDSQGTSHVIHTSASTTVQRAGASASLSDITTGAQIGAAGTKNSDGSLNAEVISMMLPHAGGQIKSVSGTDLTVTDPRDAGATTVIHVTSSTRYVTVTMGSNGPTQSASSLSALKAGLFISAEGAKNSDGSLTAELVTIMPNPPAGHGGPMGGPGDFDGDGPHNGAPPAGTSAN
ncbi:MAG TPA: DUF5666 domain-containing protein [Ktedonobacterales bacterium]|nr:DUF5666 domain-containing protein [Ktedonobacterales bacterium]